MLVLHSKVAPLVASLLLCSTFSTIWYELQVGDWPVTDQPVEAKIWLLGSGEGIKRVLAEANLGKEVTVSQRNNLHTIGYPSKCSGKAALIYFLSQEILSTCWSQEAEDRVTFTQLAEMLEKLPKLNRRLSHPGHFWKTSEYVS